MKFVAISKDFPVRFETKAKLDRRGCMLRSENSYINN
jgi:hypothetical protein